MVVPVGSLGDILALIQFANDIRKAFSEKAGSRKRYRDLISDLTADSALFRIAESLLKDAADHIDSVPELRGHVHQTLLMYTTILDEIVSELEPYAAFRSGAPSQPEAASIAVIVGGGDVTGDGTGEQVDTDRRVTKSSGSMRDALKKIPWDAWRKITWAFFKEKSIKEKIDLLAKQRKNLRFLVSLTQLYESPLTDFPRPLHASSS